jgi:hypothetical protein
MVVFDGYVSHNQRVSVEEMNLLLFPIRWCGFETPHGSESGAANLEVKHGEPFNII